MIQINLLPDVKIKYIKTDRLKRLIVTVSMIVSIVAVVVAVILTSLVYGLQANRLNSLEKSIKNNTSKLQGVSGLNKILTIQDQLNSLSTLHAQKPVTSRLFTFLPQIVPSNIQISNLNLNYATNAIVISGTAPSIAAINTFVDTLKFTKYTTNQNQNQTSAFSDVVLNQYSVGSSTNSTSSTSSTSSNAVSYGINMNFDPTIFNQNNNITLVVPQTTTTRSVINTPPALFQAQPNDNNNTGS